MDLAVFPGRNHTRKTKLDDLWVFLLLIKKKNKTVLGTHSIVKAPKVVWINDPWKQTPPPLLQHL